ncbi:hypothetical protein ACSZMI_14030 [Aeromonas veronii]
MAVGTGYSDDTELFIYDFAKAGDFRPKVLFIFDNSGSMDNTTLMAKEDYDPEFTYPVLPSDDGSDDYIYFTTGGPPKILNSTNAKRFLKNKNACATAGISLNQSGAFTSVFWNYVVTGSSDKNRKGSWLQLNSYTQSTINLVDCKQDFNENNISNEGFTNTYQSVSGKTTGYPINTSGAVTVVSRPWSVTATSAPSNNNDTNLTLYSANYLRWYYSSSTISTTRLNVAKQALRELVRTTPAVDFGLAVFNYNDSNGKMVVVLFAELSVMIAC